MFAPFKRLAAIAALPLAMTAWAVPPQAVPDDGSANPPADLSVPNKAKLALLDAPPVLPTDDSARVGVTGALGSPTGGVVLNPPSPNTKELIETPGARNSAGETVGAPIPKMPAYTVTGALVPVFRERDLNTADGMTELSFKRHPGLHFGNVSDLNVKAAHEMFLEDDWRRAKSDYSDMAHAMSNGGDPAEGRMIIQAVKDEDMELRASSDSAAGLPAFDRTQVGHFEGDSKLLQAPEDPVDIPFVRVKW